MSSPILQLLGNLYIDPNYPISTTIGFSDPITQFPIFNRQFLTVKRYLEVKTYMKTTLELFNDGQLFTSRYDDDLKEILLALEHINDTVTLLSKRNANLMEAEGAVIHIIETLSSTVTTSELSARLLESVLKRYRQRRNQHCFWRCIRENVRCLPCI